MKRLLAAALALWLAAAGVALAQNTIDALDQELKEAQQQHDDATAANLSTFFAQVDPAMNNPDTAVSLWQQSGGGMPAPTPVTTEYETESASERDARQAKDKANYDTLAALLQVHCGLLHFGGIMITDPNRKGVQDDFNAWLARAAQAYPQLSAAAAPPPGDNGDADKGSKHHRHAVPNADTGTATVPPVNLGDVMSMTTGGSLITKFLNFANAWKDKGQASWSVKSIPALYKSNILDPSRATPTETTLANWDVYIAMMQADEPDKDKWTSTDYPPLQFERAYDEYAVTPGTEKLEALVQFIHANPTNPGADDWLKRTRALLDAYRASHGGAPSAVVQNTPPPPPAPPTPGGVVVTTQQQGDAQIIITHTNGAPVNPGR
jgi:hypothetical protein